MAVFISLDRRVGSSNFYKEGMRRRGFNTVGRWLPLLYFPILVPP